jgi:hypothetical protein
MTAALVIVMAVVFLYLVLRLNVVGGITEQLTQGLAFVGLVPISNHATGSDRTIAGVDMSTLLRMMAIVDAGLVQGSVNVWFEASANSNMAGNTNMGNATGFTIQVLNGAINNALATFEIRKDQMAAGTRYLRPVLGVTTATANVALIAICDGGSYRPANQFNVTNIINATIGQVVQG